jgi:hypothetical protein
MTGFFIDPVECGAESIVVTQSGANVKTKCDGTLLPVERSEGLTDFDGMVLWAKLWVCSKCAREVK